MELAPAAQTTNSKRGENNLSHSRVRVQSTVIVEDPINTEGQILLRKYDKAVESLSPLRKKGHERLCHVLDTFLNVPQEVISHILMAPDLYDKSDKWLEWLWLISHHPFNIDLAKFLSISGSVIAGNQVKDTVVDWKSIRGQEELVHKAVRVIYPKTNMVDLLPKLLLYWFYAISLPGSLLAILLKSAINKVARAYVPHCILWSIAGCINAAIFAYIVFVGEIYRSSDDGLDYTVFCLCVAAFWFSVGLISVSGFYGLYGYVSNLYSLEEEWLVGRSKNERRHYAANRTVAALFKIVFGVDLPSYTSQWVYPIIYPLLGIIPAWLRF